MRIKKNKPVEASTVAATQATVTSGTETTDIAAGKYDEAIGYINSAISSLSVHAKEDVLAKESIANLSVVLLDLKG